MLEDIVKGGPHRSLVEEQVVKNHGRCKYQKGSNAGPDIFSVTIQFHKNVNPLSNFINLYYTHAIPKYNRNHTCGKKRKLLYWKADLEKGDNKI